MCLNWVSTSTRHFTKTDITDVKLCPFSHSQRLCIVYSTHPANCNRGVKLYITQVSKYIADVFKYTFCLSLVVYHRRRRWRAYIYLERVWCFWAACSTRYWTRLCHTKCHRSITAATSATYDSRWHVSASSASVSVSFI